MKKTVLLLLMICYHQNNKAILICFSIKVDVKMMIHTTYLKIFFASQKHTNRNNSNIIFLYKQSQRDIILLFHGIAGMDINLEEWKQLCRKAWEIEYDFLQKNGFVEVREGRYSISNCNKTTYAECTPETKPFWLT